ncbi:MAG: radical SAM protein, partial [bacterium]
MADTVSGGEPEEENRVKLQAVTIQLTRRCNLHCRMCGQWGEKGYQHSCRDQYEMDLSRWLLVADRLAPLKPYITIWGGEPLLVPWLGDFCCHLAELGLQQSLVTNGVLLKGCVHSLKGLFEWIYISLDGPPEIHDLIRGVNGTFARIEDGIQRIRQEFPHQKLAVMTTLLPENMGRLGELAVYLRKWGMQDWLLSPQIFLSREQLQLYSEWLSSCGIRENTGASWLAEFSCGYGGEMAESVERLMADYPDLRLRLSADSMQSEQLLPWYDDPEADILPLSCRAPWHRLSIRSDGSTSFCLDVSDGSLGSVLEKGIEEIFQGPEADRFRKEIGLAGNPA